MDIKKQEKLIELINFIDKYFDFYYLEDLYINTDYSGEFNMLSDKLDELYKDGISEEELNSISKLDKAEIFNLDIGDRFINNNIRNQILKYINEKDLYLDYELIKNNIKNNYKLAKYVKDKSKLIELLDLNDEVMLLIDSKYLNDNLIINIMKKTDVITRILLNMYEEKSDIFDFSNYLKNNEEINKLLFEQSIKYLDEDPYRYIKSAKIIKSNIDISKYVVSKDSKLIHYVDEEIRNNI